MERLLPDFGKFKLFSAPIHDDCIDVFRETTSFSVLVPRALASAITTVHRVMLRRTPVRTRRKGSRMDRQ